MNKNSHHWGFRYLCCITTAIVSTISVAGEGDVKLIEKISSQLSENEVLLKTWSGSAKIHDTAKIEDFEQHTDFHLKFGWDRSSDRWFFVLKCVRQDFPGHNSDQPGNLVDTETGFVFRDGRYSRYTASAAAADGTRTQAVVHDASLKSKPGWFSVFFDPHMVYQLRSDPANTRLTNALKAWNASWNGSTVTRVGDIVKLAEINTAIPDAKAEYEFDLNRGGQLTELACSDSTTSESWTADWEQVGGAWVPLKITLSNRNSSNINTRTITFEHNVVNEPMGDDRFQIETIGVQPGAVVTDKISNTTSIYRENEIAPPPDPTDAQKAPRQRKKPWTPIFLAVNGVVLALLIGIGFIRNRSQKR